MIVLLLIAYVFRLRRRVDHHQAVADAARGDAIRARLYADQALMDARALAAEWQLHEHAAVNREPGA